MRQMIRYIAVLLLLGIFTTYLSCINTANPYDDITKAKIVIAENSLKDGDTVIVDSTYSLILDIYLEYFIDRFTININKNAKWQDTTVRIDDLEENPARFDVAFYDTGRIEIKITTYYTDNRSSVQKIYVHGITVSGPKVTVMSGDVMGDTIETNTIPFTLKVRIEDASNELDTMHINDEEFDSIYKESDTLYYCYETFNEQDFENTPIQARIYAENIIQQNITETYWICSTSVVDTSIKIIRIDPPDSDDTITVYKDSISVNGRIDGITNDAAFYYLFRKINGYMSDTMNIITKSNNTWQRKSKYSGLWNRIVFYLFNTTDTGSTPIDSNVLIVNYIDTTSTGPTIVSIKGDGADLQDSSIVDKDTLTVSVTVKKLNSGIKEVLINSTSADPVNDSIFEGDITLAHTQAGNTIKVLVKDSAGKTGGDTLTVYYNNAPVFTKVPSFDNVYAEVLFNDTVSVNDDDGDTVTITAQLHLNSGDTTIPVDPSGSFSWIPAIEDTAGSAEITFTINDGYEQKDSTVTFKVSGSGNTLFFLITEDDFQDTIDFSEDTLKVVLSTGGTCTGTRYFSIIMDDTDTLWGPNETDSGFSWIPTGNDTGLHTLEVVVTAEDSLHDTVNPAIYVPSIKVYYDSASSEAVEGTTYHSFTVSISKAHPDTGFVVFWVDTAQSSADSNDFNVWTTPDTLKFFENIRQREILIMIEDDPDQEGDETLVFKLKKPSGGLVVGRNPKHTVTIIDND
ncbi:Ig-like domain-containing protein [Fibrobacterota bacterium]